MLKKMTNLTVTWPDQGEVWPCWGNKLQNNPHQLGTPLPDVGTDPAPGQHLDR